jgi:hypothetical protein
LTVLKELLIYNNILEAKYNIETWDYYIKQVNNSTSSTLKNINIIKDDLIKNIYKQTEKQIKDIDVKLQINKNVKESKDYCNLGNEYFKYSKENTLESSIHNKKTNLNVMQNHIKIIIDNSFVTNNIVSKDIKKEMQNIYKDKLNTLTPIFDLTTQKFTDAETDFFNKFDSNFASYTIKHSIDDLLVLKNKLIILLRS